MFLAKLVDVQITSKNAEAMPRGGGEDGPAVMTEVLHGHVMEEHGAISGSECAMLHEICLGALQATKEAEDVEDLLASVI